MMTPISASGPIWADAAHTRINLQVVFEELGEVAVPFTAAAQDFEQHGIALFESAVAGDFGPISAYVPPPLDALREARVIYINGKWQQADLGTFEFDGHPIGCGDDDRKRIDAIASYVSLFGALPADFPGAWKSADGAWASVPDVTAFKAMVSAMVAQGMDNFARAQARKAAIAAATDAAEIAAVEW